LQGEALPHGNQAAVECDPKALDLERCDFG